MRAVLLLVCIVTPAVLAALSVPDPKEESVEKRMSYSDQQKIVAAHNKYRQSVVPKARGMNTLSWDKNLASLAQKWADGCNKGHGNPQADKQRLYGSTYIGQNMYWGSLDGVLATKAWYDEVNFYDRCSRSCMPGKVCGHYTQVVWAKTLKVGCGVAQCGNNPMVVCNYLAGGNFNNEAPYELANPSNCNRCQSHFCGANGRPAQYYPSCKCKCTKLYTGDKCDQINCLEIRDNYRCRRAAQFVYPGSGPCRLGSSSSFKIGEPAIHEICPHACGHCKVSRKPKPNPNPNPQPKPQPGPNCNGAVDGPNCRSIIWYFKFLQERDICDKSKSYTNSQGRKYIDICPISCKKCPGKREIDSSMVDLAELPDME